jgi:hypothetical protein
MQILIIVLANVAAVGLFITAVRTFSSDTVNFRKANSLRDKPRFRELYWKTSRAESRSSWAFCVASTLCAVAGVAALAFSIAFLYYSSSVISLALLVLSTIVILVLFLTVFGAVGQYYRENRMEMTTHFAGSPQDYFKYAANYYRRSPQRRAKLREETAEYEEEMKK